MSTSPKALVEAPVLAWMRNSAGFSIDELAHKIGTSPDVIHSWETGEEQPSMAQVRKLALAYKRPISDLFLLTPPQAQLLPHDFRRTSDLIGQRYSPQLRHELRASARRRQLALDLIEESQEAPPAPIPLRITQAQDPESIGLAIRTLLRITTTEQKACAAIRARHTRAGAPGSNRSGSSSSRSRAWRATRCMGSASPRSRCR